jgi:predicted dehydrogenase
MARIGIIGTGWGARTQVPAFQSAGLEIAGIAGSDPEKTLRAGQKLGVPSFQDWRALVGEAAIDLVSIVTPPSEHAAMALAALEAGKHVLSEKPTALDASEAGRMVEAADRHPGQLALIDHELRFLPAWREARRRVSRIGPLRYLEARYSSPGRADRTRLWNWWSDANQGGGVWGAVGSHLVDALRYFAGEVKAIQAFLHTFITERPSDAGTRRVTSDDFAAVHVSLESSAFATMTFSVVAGVDEPSTLTIHGERGALRLEAESLWAASPGGDWVKQVEGEAPALPGNSPGGAFGTGTLYLGRALRAALDEGDREALAPAASFADGLEQQRILDAARRSHEKGGSWERVE